MLTDEFVDMLGAGHHRPGEGDALGGGERGSIAGMILTTEALITDKPEEKAAAAGDAGRRRDGLLVLRILLHRKALARSARAFLLPKKSFFQQGLVALAPGRLRRRESNATIRRRHNE